MPNNSVVSCLIAAFDELNHIKALQEAVELSLEQLDDLSQKPQQRLDFLLNAYRAKQESHIHELEIHLSSLLKMLLTGK